MRRVSLHTLGCKLNQAEGASITGQFGSAGFDHRGHSGPSLSIVEILITLYFQEMNLNEENPKWPERDRFILSKGHACPVWYAALAERGYFDKDHLGTLRRMDSILQGHPTMNKTPGIDMTAGSLGHGLSAGLGMG